MRRHVWRDGHAPKHHECHMKAEVADTGGHDREAPSTSHRDSITGSAGALTTRASEGPTPGKRQAALQEGGGAVDETEGNNQERV